MDTKKHLEVATRAYRTVRGLSTEEGALSAGIASLKNDGLLCTEVEREFVEAWLECFSKSIPMASSKEASDRYERAYRALLAERAGKPVEPEPSEADALRAEIATLKERLAEATSRPTEGSVRHDVIAEKGTATVHENRLCWGHIMASATFRGPDAEQRANDFAAKLDAEQGGQS